MATKVPSNHVIKNSRRKVSGLKLQHMVNIICSIRSHVHDHLYLLYRINIDAISGALITLSLSILILNSHCEEGARDGNDIWYLGITIFDHVIKK